MAIEHNAARQKIVELNRVGIVLTDMLNIHEVGAIGVQMNAIEQIPLTPGQMDALAGEMEDAGNDLKVLAGVIKDLVK